MFIAILTDNSNNNTNKHSKDNSSSNNSNIVLIPILTNTMIPPMSSIIPWSTCTLQDFARKMSDYDRKKAVDMDILRQDPLDRLYVVGGYNSFRLKA